jgi:hypothetical protein
VLVVVAVVGGVASSGGAQVDPVFPTPRAVWASSCVPPGGSELVVYGRGWGGGPVDVEVSDQSRRVGGASVPTVDRPGGSVFQGRVGLSVPAGAGALRLVVSQAGATAEHPLVASGSCAPAIGAVVDTPCAPPSRPVVITVNVRGAPPSAFDLVLHHADLFGPAEAVNRSQPARPDGDYTFPLTVPNAPGRVVPVTVEARRPNGSFAYATANVGLPPACSVPGSTTPTSPATVPGTTQPTSAATTASPRGPTVTVPPFSLPRPNDGTGRVALNLSPALGRAGEATTVVGRGFAPSTAVTLRWRPGIGEWTVTTGGDGTFRTQVLVLPNDVEGPRALEVVSGGAPPAPYLVVPGSHQPAFGGVFL